MQSARRTQHLLPTTQLQLRWKVSVRVVLPHGIHDSTTARRLMLIAAFFPQESRRLEKRVAIHNWQAALVLFTFEAASCFSCNSRPPSHRSSALLVPVKRHYTPCWRALVLAAAQAAPRPAAPAYSDLYSECDIVVFDYAALDMDDYAALDMDALL